MKGNDMNAKEMRTKEEYQFALAELEIIAITYVGETYSRPKIDLLQELIDNYKENNDVGN